MRLIERRRAKAFKVRPLCDAQRHNADFEGKKAETYANFYFDHHCQRGGLHTVSSIINNWGFGHNAAPTGEVVSPLPALACGVTCQASISVRHGLMPIIKHPAAKWLARPVAHAPRSQARERG